MAIYENEQKLSVKHKLPGFFIVYLLSTLPGIIVGLLSCLLIVVLIIAAIAGIGKSQSNASSEDLNFKYVSESGSNSSNNLLIYNLEGVIQSGGSEQSSLSKRLNVYSDVVEEDFKKIKEDKSIKSVVFKVNSPGGEVFASQVLGDQIKDLIASKGINKATFYFDQIAASGALFAAYKVPNYVVANPYGETGSIGVRLELPNVQKLADNIGYKQIVIKSSPSKDIGNPFRDPTNDETAYFQKTVDKVYNDFTTIVANGRNLEINRVKEISNGLTYFNEEAKNYGLVDEVGNLDKAITQAAKESNISDYKVMEIEPKKSIIDEFTASMDVPKLLGISNATVDNLNKINSLKKGELYMVDDRRI